MTKELLITVKLSTDDIMYFYVDNTYRCSHWDDGQEYVYSKWKVTPDGWFFCHTGDSVYKMGRRMAHQPLINAIIERELLSE